MAPGSAPRPGRPAGSGSGGPSPRARRSPASSAASAIDRSQAAGVLAPREPRQLEHHGEPLRGAAVGGRVAAASRRRSRRRRRSRAAPRGRGPSPRRPARRGPRANRLSCVARAVAGTTYARSALRRRRLLGRGVDHDGDRRQPGGSAPPSSQARRRPRSRPRVSTTVVSPRESRAATMRSRSSNASSVASRSCGAAADDAAQVVGRHDLRRRGSAPGREVRLARPRGSDEDQECGIGQVLHTTGVCQEGRGAPL